NRRKADNQRTEGRGQSSEKRELFNQSIVAALVSSAGTKETGARRGERPYNPALLLALPD
ncbi:MAG: hypothetical protein DMF14_16130, partial [Verrucomicrobia bacterium]